MSLRKVFQNYFCPGFTSRQRNKIQNKKEREEGRKGREEIRKDRMKGGREGGKKQKRKSQVC